MTSWRSLPTLSSPPNRGHAGRHGGQFPWHRAPMSAPQKGPMVGPRPTPISDPTGLSCEARSNPRVHLGIDVYNPLQRWSRQLGPACILPTVILGALHDMKAHNKKETTPCGNVTFQEILSSCDHIFGGCAFSDPMINLQSISLLPRLMEEQINAASS